MQLSRAGLFHRQRSGPALMRRISANEASQVIILLWQRPTTRTCCNSTREMLCPVLPKHVAVDAQRMWRLIVRATKHNAGTKANLFPYGYQLFGRETRERHLFAAGGGVCHRAAANVHNCLAADAVRERPLHAACLDVRQGKSKGGTAGDDRCNAVVNICTPGTSGPSCIERVLRQQRVLALLSDPAITASLSCSAPAVT